MDWLGWNRGVERDRQVLESILALLLGLAAMADRASGLSASDRLLGYLGLAEAEARGFVIGMLHESGAPAPDAAPSSAASHPERLAASFRALAFVLAAMLAQAGRLARLTRAAGSAYGQGRPRAAWRRGRGAGRIAVAAVRRAAFPPAPDTS